MSTTMQKSKCVFCDKEYGHGGIMIDDKYLCMGCLVKVIRENKRIKTELMELMK